MPEGDRAPSWIARAGWLFLGYVLLIGFTAPFWIHFAPPKSVGGGLAFFTLLPLAGLLLYLTGELLLTPWRELPRWGRVVKISSLVALPLALVLLALAARRV